MRKRHLEVHLTSYEDSKMVHLYVVQGHVGEGSDLVIELLLPSWKAPSAVADSLSELLSAMTGD